MFIPSAEIVREKGLENVTVDDLVAEITPKGRGMSCCFYAVFNSLQLSISKTKTTVICDNNFM